MNLEQPKHQLDYNQLAQEYAQHRKVQTKVLEQLLSVGEICRESRVLEVGCGTGNYIAAIQAATGAACWGIDPSSLMLGHARETTTRVNFQAGGGEKLEYPENFFNLVFSVDVIHHMQDPARYSQEAYRVLSPGGRVCTVTESSRMIRNRRPFAVYFPETVSADLQRYPTLTQLKSMLRAAGFDEIRCQAVKFSFEITDIQDFRARAYSCLHLISEQGYQQGIERMERDLERSPIPWVSQYQLIWGRKPDVEMLART